MPRFFFIAEDQLDELERLIEELPTRQTRVACKLIEGLKDGQQLPGKLVEALVSGKLQQQGGAEGQSAPPTKAPAPVGKPDGAPAQPPPTEPPPPAAASQVVKGANAVAVSPPKE